MLALARALERGAIDGLWARCLSAAWGRVAARSIARPLRWPSQTRIVAVGGATLGGSGKTPLAIACAAELASSGARVAFVGHGYRARASRPRRVTAADRVADVGDEALLAALLLGERTPVVVGGRRAALVAFAAQQADVLVLDGVLQTRPTRAALSLLAVDPCEPWGHAGAVPPRGDLRAPVKHLLAACDAVVPVGDPLVRLAVDRDVWPVRVRSGGAWVPGDEASTASFLSWDELRRLRVGVVAALARPERVVRQLSARGVRIAALVCARDHGPLGLRRASLCRRLAQKARLDLWVATHKCSLHALTWRCGHRSGEPGLDLGAPLATVEHSIALPKSLCDRLRALTVP